MLEIIYTLTGHRLAIDLNAKGFNFNVIEKCDAYFGIVCLKIYKANESVKY